MPKTWSFEYKSKDGEREGAFDTDITNNELRPVATVSHQWTEYSISDADGYYTIPLEFYLEAKAEATDDKPATDQFRDYFIFQQLGLLGDSIDLILYMFFSTIKETFPVRLIYISQPSCT